MSYSEDLRNQVRRYIANGGSKVEAVRIFNVGRTTIYDWLNHPRPCGKPGRVRADKIDEEQLHADVRLYPDKLLRERAEKFHVSISGMCKAMKRLGYKKNAKIS